MTRKPAVLAWALMAFMAFTGRAGLAEARPFRVGQLPSAPNGCNTCHTNGGGSALNVFGQDVARTLGTSPSMASVEWSRVCMLDSDGDGASNAVELGDERCAWRVGDSPRSARGDPADPTVTPDEASLEDAGGCSAGGRSGATTELAWALLGWVVLVRCRRYGGRMECSPGSEA